MTIAIEAPARALSLPQPRSRSRRWHLFFRRPLALPGFLMIGCVVFVALAAPLIAGDPIEQDTSAVLEPPSWQHPFGVDDVGRDVWSRVAWGARTSLSVGLIATAIGLGVGVALGLTAGYAGGWADTAIMRLIDTILAFPTLILALAITATLGPSLSNAMIAVGVVAVPRYARLVRGQVLSLRETDFVLAARAVGIAPVRITLRHILPNVASPLIVLTSLNIAQAIVAEASLSFLGLGAQPPSPSWGTMLSRGRDYLEIAPWTAVAPGLAIFVTVLGFNFLGDTVRDALDPTSSRGG